jgi:hypothetical protein
MFVVVNKFCSASQPSPAAGTAPVRTGLPYVPERVREFQYNQD